MTAFSTAMYFVAVLGIKEVDHNQIQAQFSSIILVILFLMLLARGEGEAVIIFSLIRKG